MPKFQLTIERVYSARENFIRIVEAEDMAAAYKAGAVLAADADANCPDDCSEMGGEGAADFSVVCAAIYRGGQPADHVAGEPLE